VPAGLSQTVRDFSVLDGIPSEKNEKIRAKTQEEGNVSKIVVSPCKEKFRTSYQNRIPHTFLGTYSTRPAHNTTVVL
jgi:hypothetical protein